MAFNPYHEWLGLDDAVTKPTYYQLIGLEDFEADPQLIARAADSASSRVRACKPGEHAALWAKLIDQIKQVKAYLLDENRRAAYDNKLRTKQSSASTSGGANPMYPPGMGNNNGEQKAEPDEIAPVPIQTEPESAPAADNPVSSAMAIPLPAVQEQAPAPVAPMQPMPAAGGVPVLEPVTPEPHATAPMPAMPQAVTPLAVPLPQSVNSDPMAPLSMNPAAASPQLPAGMPAAPAIDPMAPVAVDPMAPAPATNPMVPAMPVPAAPATAVAPNFAPATQFGMPQQPAVGVAPVAPVPGIPMLEGQATDEPAPVVGSTSPALMANSRRQRGLQQMVIMGMGLMVFAAFAGGVYYVVQNLTENEVVSSDPAHEPNPPAPANPPDQPRSTDPIANPPQPPENPVPPTPPMPELSPEPSPMPEPMTVTPTPMPEPPKPVPVVKPPKEEVEALAAALLGAKDALAEKNLEGAKGELEKAEPLAKLPEHKAKLARLQQVNENIVAFWSAVEQAADKLAAGEVLKYRDSEIVVVESSRENVILKASGTRIERVPQQLPDGVAILFIDLALPKEDPMTKIIKGSFYAINVGKNEDHAQTAKQFWQEAGLEGAEVEDLLLFLEDDYDLVKDLD